MILDLFVELELENVGFCGWGGGGGGDTGEPGEKPSEQARQEQTQPTMTLGQNRKQKTAIPAAPSEL